jgi:hypothetical protein
MLNGAAAPVGHFEFKRGDVTRFVRRHEFAWEAGMATLTAIYVILSFFEDSAALALNPYTAVLFSLSAVFLTEFGIRYWDAPARTKYPREHWLDLVTSFPLIGPLRALRLLRLLRFLRLGRSVRALTRT